jgi:hypothetical protein
LPKTPEDERLANASSDRARTLQQNLADGAVYLAAQTFVDSLNGPGAWALRPPELKQLFFDNVGTATQMRAAPATSCEQVAKFDFPILLVHGERSPKKKLFCHVGSGAQMQGRSRADRDPQRRARYDARQSGRLQRDTGRFPQTQ